MKTRVTTRVLVIKNNKLLLSRNKGEIFWYPGGGGWEEGENLRECCVREVAEETGQKVKVVDLMYIREFSDPKKEVRNLELLFLAEPLKDSKDSHFHNDEDIDNPIQVEENRWFSEDDIRNKKMTVFPEFLKNKFWQDLSKFDKGYQRYWEK